MTDSIVDTLAGSNIPETPPEHEYNLYDANKAASNDVGIGNFFTSGEDLAESDRYERAIAAKNRALENLSNKTSLDNSYTDLGNGWLEHNGNKMWNDMTDHEVQSLEYYMRTKRSLQEQEDGTRLDENGNPYSGNARRNYNYGTKAYSDSVTKYGASRGDLDSADPRYTPGIVKGRRYGWESGELGVDTAHKGLDVLYRKDDGDMLEALIQGREKALEGRTVKGTVEDAHLREQYGDGWSEYYNSPEALFGKQTEVDVELGRDLFNQYMSEYRRLKGMPSVSPQSVPQDIPSSDYERIKAQQLAWLENGGQAPTTEESIEGVDVPQSDYERIKAQQQAWLASQGKPAYKEGGVENAIRGFGSTFISELAINPADALGDATGWFDLGTNEEKVAMVNGWTGYDPKAAQEAMHRVGQKWDIVANEEATVPDRMRAARDGIIEAIVTPELLGTSLGAVLSWVTPGSVTKLMGVGTRYDKLAKLADMKVAAGTMTRAEAIKQKTKAFMSLDGAKSFVINQSGFATAAMGNVNNQYEEFVANNNGKELEGADKLKWFSERFGIQMVNQNLDKFVDFQIIKHPGMLKGLKPLVKAMTKKEFGNVVTGMTKGLVATTVNMGAEAGQEYAQTMMELYNSRHGSEQYKDVEGFINFLTHEDNIRESGVAALAGAGGAVQFEGVGTIGGAVRDTLFSASKAGGKLGETLKSKKPPQTDPLPSEEHLVADEELSDEARAARTGEATASARKVVDKYSSMFADEEFVQLMAAEDLKDEELIDAPKLKANLAKYPSNYRVSLDEIEQAEATLESLAGTDAETEVDGISLKLLRKTKREIYKNLMDDGSHPTLGSGYTPEDVIEEFIDTLDVDGEGVDITKEEQDIVDRFLSVNDIPTFRFKQLVTGKVTGGSKKDAHTVYRESITDGPKSASAYRKSISKLVHTPNPSRKELTKKLNQLDNFQVTQEERKVAFDAVIKEQEANINTFNTKRREGKTILASEEKFHMGKHFVAGYDNAYVFVEKDDNGYLRISESSKAISKSIADTIEYNQRTKERYAKHIGKVLGKDHKKSNILVVRDNRDQKKARDFDQEFYKRVGATKAIVDDKNPGKTWKVGADYRSDNASKVNSGVYDEGDVVILSSHAARFSKSSAMYKELKKALKGGARIVIDRNDAEIHVHDLEEFLRSMGFFAMPRKQLSKDRYGNYRKMYVNLDVATGIAKQANKKTHLKERKAARKKELVTAIDFIGDNTPEQALKAGDITQKEYERFSAALLDSVQDFPKFADSPTKLHKAMRDVYDTEVKKQTKHLVERLMTNVVDKGNIWAPYDAELLALDDLVTKEVILAEARDQAIDIIDAKIIELSKGADLVAQWAEIVADGKKGIKTEDGKTADEWLEALPDARSIGNKLLEDSIGKNRPGSDRKLNGSYVYYDTEAGTFSAPAASTASFPKGAIIHRLDFDPSGYLKIGKVTPLNTLDADNLRMQGTDQGPIGFNQMIVTAVSQMEFALRQPVTVFNGDKPDILDFSSSPAASLIFDKDLNINQNLAVAAHLALHNYIRNYGYLLGKGNKTKLDIANLLGLREEQISREAMDMLRDKGMLYKTAANSIGKDIANMMGFERDTASNSDAQAYDALLADLGQTALLMGMHHKDDNPNGVLEVDNTVTSKDYATKVLQKPYGEVKDGTGAKTLFVNLAEDAEETVEIMSDMAKSIAEAIPDIDVGRKEPNLRPISQKAKDKATSKIRKEKLGLGIAPDSKKALNELMDTEWTADLDLMADMIDNKEDIMKLMGYIPVSEPARVNPDYEVLSFEEKNVQESINRGIEKSFEEMQWLRDTFEGKKTASLWFKYYFSKNGRFFMDTNTINPQTDKHLHRFSVQPKSHTFQVVKKGNKFVVDGKDVTYNMHYAIAQALGMSVDKKGTAAITKFGSRVFKKLNTEAKIAKAKEAFLAGEKFDLGDGFVIEKEHIGHALQAFKLLQDLATSKGKPVTTSITAEFDAVTSGFGLKLQQMPIIGSLHGWLTRVGIVAADDEALKRADEISMNDLLDSGKVKDSYQTLAFDMEPTEFDDMVQNLHEDANINIRTEYTKGIWAALSDALPQKVDDAISSELRNLFKPPFMTFNYSASIKNIRENLLTGQLLQDLAKKMAAVDLNSTKEKDLKVIGLMEAFMHGGGTAAELQEMVREQPLSRIRAYKGGNTFEHVLKYMIEASYGVQVENILNDYFGPFVEAQDKVNKSFTAMFEVFITTFEDRLGKLRTTKGAVTKQEEDAIYEELVAQWPAIKGPLSKMLDGVHDGIGIYDTETASPFGMWSGRKPVRALLSDTLSKKWGGQKDVRVSHMVKQLSAAIAAGSVVPIHYVDGAVMGQTINGAAEAGVKGITAIHDAIMPPLVHMGRAQYEYNKQVFQLNASYSFIDQVASALRKVIDDTNVDLNSSIYSGRKVKTKDDEGKWVYVPLNTFFTDSYNDFADLANQVAKSRKSLYETLNRKGAMIMHMAGTPDGVYHIDPGHVEYKEVDKYKATGENMVNANDTHTSAKNLKC